MTNEERGLIGDCRVLILASGEFRRFLKCELDKMGFKEIIVIGDDSSFINTDNIHAYKERILIEDLDRKKMGLSSLEDLEIPVVIPVDLIEGAGVMVFFPGDDKGLLCQSEFRIRAAKYMAGYCSFWKIPDSNWLFTVITRIENGETSEKAQKTAALICAKIAANIAVSRPIKHFPRFYLSRNLQEFVVGGGHDGFGNVADS